MPARLSRLSELRSCGKASKGAHLAGRWRGMHHLGPQQAQWLSCPPGACSFSCTPLKSESQAPGTTSCFLTLSGMPVPLPGPRCPSPVALPLPSGRHFLPPSSVPPTSLHHVFVIPSNLPPNPPWIALILVKLRCELKTRQRHSAASRIQSFSPACRLPSPRTPPRPLTHDTPSSRGRGLSTNGPAFFS